MRDFGSRPSKSGAGCENLKGKLAVIEPKSSQAVAFIEGKNVRKTQFCEVLSIRSSGRGEYWA